MQLHERCGDRGFSGPVTIEDFASGHLPGQSMRQRIRTGFATEIDQAQAVFRQLNETDQRRHGMQYRNVLAPQRLSQGIGIGHHISRRDPQRGADEIGDPYLLKRHVEGD